MILTFILLLESYKFNKKEEAYITEHNKTITNGTTHPQFRFPISFMHSNWSYSDANSYHAVAGADFNYDGKLDLLVSGRNNDVNNTYFLHIYFGNYETFGTLFPWMQWSRAMITQILKEHKSSHTVGPMLDVGTAADEVLVMDANGDLLPDLFGTPAQSTKPSFWINRDKATSFEMYVYIIQPSVLHVAMLFCYKKEFH